MVLTEQQPAAPLSRQHVIDEVIPDALIQTTEFGRRVGRAFRWNDRRMIVDPGEIGFPDLLGPIPFLLCRLMTVMVPISSRKDLATASHPR